MSSSGVDIRIRVAAPSDVPQLVAVQLESALAAFAHIFPASVPKPRRADLEVEWQALVTGSAHRVLVAEISGVAVAAAVFGADAELAPPGHGLLAKLYVLPDYFGKGIGSALYDAAIEQMRQDGWQKLWLWVLEGNLVARRMYERRGWAAQEQRRTEWPGSGVYEMGYSLELTGAEPGVATRPG